MKKFLLSLLVIVLALLLLGAAGYAGHRYGFTQSLVAASKGNAPSPDPGYGMNPRGMHQFGFALRFDRGKFSMMGRGFGFGFFPLLGLLLRLLFLGLIIAAIYWLITRSGWRLTRTSPATTTTTTTTVVETPPPGPTGENNHSDGL